MMMIMKILSHTATILFFSQGLLAPIWIQAVHLPTPQIDLEPVSDTTDVQPEQHEPRKTPLPNNEAVNKATLHDDSWEQVGKDIIGRFIDRDLSFAGFGCNVALSSSGNIVAIDAFFCKRLDLQEHQWCVFVVQYDEKSGGWVQRGDTIFGPETKINDFHLSLTVSENADTIVVGSSVEARPNIPNLRGSDSGEPYGGVFIYRWDPIERQYVLKVDPLYGSRPYSAFGSSVSITSDDKLLAIASPGAKKVYILEWTGADYKTHTLSTRPVNSFGDAVALSDTGILALTSHPKHPRKPQILMLKRTDDDGGGGGGGGGSWKSMASPFHLTTDPVVLSISRDGTVVVAGNALTRSEISGSVWTYAYNDDGWIPRGQVLRGQQDYDCFGSSVALSANGATLAVGATQGYGPGYVLLYNYEGENDEWIKAITEPFEEDNIVGALGASVTFSADAKVLAIGSDGLASKVKVFAKRAVRAAGQHPDTSVMT